MTYDHWKTTNPNDRWLGPNPDEEWRERMDIETMRGEIIDHKSTIQMLKTAVADLQTRVTKLENDKADDGVFGTPVGQGPDPTIE